MNAARLVVLRRLRATLLLLLVLGLPACGARGAPLPPFRPSPPALTGLQVSQRGGTAVLELDRVMPAMPVEGGTVQIASVQLLLYTERYAAMTPEILATALERERFERLEQAREAREAAELAAAQRQAQREADAAAEEVGEELPEDLAVAGAEGETGAEPEEEEEDLTESERLIRGVPDDVLSMWREANLRGAVILESARRLDDTVDRLWSELGLPVAIVDIERPPPLPDPADIIEVAREVAETVSYERTMASPEFLGLAAPVRELSLEDLRGNEPAPDPDAEQADGAVLEYGVGIPSSGPFRTRYFFAVRAVSMEGERGTLSDIVSLAPAAVPVPPGAPIGEVVEEGIELSWRHSGGDTWGRLLEPGQIGYNVYRRLASERGFEREPINDEPLEEPEFLDEDVAWDESYVYEVRASRVAGDEEDSTSSPTRESAGVRSAEIAAVDVFPPDPPRSPEALRTGSRLTLRWTPPTDDGDIAGYRIYRHTLPAPEVPEELLREEDREEEEEAEADAGESAATDDDTDTELPAREEETAGEDATAEPDPASDEDQEPEDGAQADSGDQEEGAGEEVEREDRPDHPDRVRERVLRRLGFELLTERSVEATRYIDSAADPATGYVYLIEALDEQRNVSLMARIEAPLPEDGG